MLKQTIFMVSALTVLLGFAFKCGLEYLRHQIRAVVEDVANTDQQTGTNSFSRCLTELWEQTGELDTEWKGKRRWHLAE